MKSISLNKDNNFSLNVSENYKKELECDVSVVSKKYTELIVEYFKFILVQAKFIELTSSWYIFFVNTTITFDIRMMF